MANPSKCSADFIAAAQSILASNDEAARKQMLDTAMKAATMLEAPLDTVWRMIMSPHAPAALMTLLKAGVIQEIAKSDSATSADQLSKATEADRLLIVRLLRPLNALGFVNETKQEEYAPTAITKMLVDRALLGGFQFMFSAATRSLASLPFYFEKTHYKNVNGAPGPFQDAHKTQDNMFPWLIKDPPMMGNFNAFMTGQRADRKQWFDFFEVDDILLNGSYTDSNATLLVDVAGGEGVDLAEFHKRFPDASGRLILQDLPPVIDSIQDLPPKIERQKHDFFQEQPIKGARCYYYRSILHDWPDADCITILKNTAAAMSRGYSKLLLSEFVLPASNTPLYPALLDINMMALLNGMERTEAQFTKLLDAAGLKVVKFCKLHIGPSIQQLEWPNIRPNFPPDVNRGMGLVTTAWILGAFGTSLLAMRMYTRAAIIKKIGSDDWTMLVAVILALVTGAIVTLMVHYGVGRHALYLSEDERANAVYYIWLSVPFSPGSAAVGKVSIALLLLRLMNRNRKLEAFLWVLIFSLVVVNLVLIIITFAQCTPVTFLWNRVRSGAHGTCWAPSIQQDYGYFQGAFSAWSDFVLALFPILIIRNLEMPLKTKLGICFLMSLGIIATVAAAVKTVELRNLATQDFTWDAVPLVYWFLLENWIIIICACVPTIKPLLLKANIIERLVSHISGKSVGSTGDTNQSSGSYFNIPSSRQQDPFSSKQSRQPTKDRAKKPTEDAFDLPVYGQGSHSVTHNRGS
ncbi:hypothetical protein NUW58_g3112 [Xylaria curta]|uniref:Uncharacterized protein n=1 Tax=Xylaria curta TaxID=42375 RepID=A0ACC1PF37_9PEZI|nr:hypothetical protein NUW58_g3112 [Xylaria curta]